MSKISSFPDAFFRELHPFLGHLLLQIMRQEPSHELSFELKNLWIAASHVFGLFGLTHIVQEVPELKNKLSASTEQPLDSLTRVPTQINPNLLLGSALQRFSQRLELDADYQERQDQYVYLLENLERNFKSLQRELEEQTLTAKEHKHEILELFTHSLYTITRLQRDDSPEG